MILTQLFLLTSLLQSQGTQATQNGTYYIAHGSYKDEYFPTFMTDPQKEKFEAALKEVKTFSQYSRLVRKIPTNMPHDMFVMFNGDLTSLFFRNANLGNMAEGAELKVSANYSNGDTMTQHLIIAPGMPGIKSNFRVHFMHKADGFVKTMDIVVHLKDDTWVKVANWKPTGPQIDK